MFSKVKNDWLSRLIEPPLKAIVGLLVIGLAQFLFLAESICNY
jgi:hypothetical protein